MRRLLPLVALVGIIVVVVALQQITTNRPDEPGESSPGVIVFAVENKEFTSAADPGDTLWSACQGAISSITLSLAPTFGPLYLATVLPVPGENAQRRLTGCLHDGTVDRLRGNLIMIASP